MEFSGISTFYFNILLLCEKAQEKETRCFDHISLQELLEERGL